MAFGIPLHGSGHASIVHAASIALLMACAAPAAAQVILFVDDDAPPGGDGVAWESAMSDLQDALAAARLPSSDVTELWIAAGIYTPSVVDATLSFDIPSGLALYGGFAGGESSRDQRDPARNDTRLSGDIGRDDELTSGPWWYQSWVIHSSNSGKVVTITDADASTRLDGLIISNGHLGPAGTPSNSPLMSGSGITIEGGSPVIAACTIEHNLAAFSYGGGLLCVDTSATIVDCLIRENYGHLSNGGGAHVYGATSPTFDACEFRWNTIVSSAPDAAGAGISHRGTAPLSVRGCRFVGNIARSFWPVGTDVTYGGGVMSLYAPLEIESCIFDGNQAMYGGGVMTFAGATIANSLFVGNIAIVHPADPYPEIGGEGAAVHGLSYQPRTIDLRQCTVTGNSGKKHAVNALVQAELMIRNSIIWGNTATHPEVTGTWRAELGGSFDLAYSCARYIFEAPGDGEDPIDPRNLPGCTQADPTFVSALDRHLAPGSPCIDSGDNGEVSAELTQDLDEQLRFVDDPQTPDTGVGNGPIVDMGCYEVQSTSPCPSDLDDDGQTGFNDLLQLLGAWGACPSCEADLDGDGEAGFPDLLALLSAWGACE